MEKERLRKRQKYLEDNKDKPYKLLKAAIQTNTEPLEYLSKIAELDNKEKILLRDAIQGQKKYRAKTVHKKKLSDLTDNEIENDEYIQLLIRWRSALKNPDIDSIGSRSEKDIETK